MEIESLLKDLIKIESITPKDEGCFDLIEPFLKDLGFKCERIDYDNVENLYAVLGNEGLRYLAQRRDFRHCHNQCVRI